MAKALQGVWRITDGPYVFRLPDIGEGVAEAEIVAWHVKPGDHVREDAPLLDVMTDKATVDMTSPVDGVVVRSWRSRRHGAGGLGAGGIGSGGRRRRAGR